ncbi:MAG: glycosyltransferase family 2 protein [Thermodesulfovibrionales bacterium]|nr:glycosyltransferase family 2 protein [Thermodesulfovibrionales bacterium]
MEREKVSITIITYNEEDNIRACLESISWADEIVVVDSGSNDKTVEICKEYTERVFFNTWEGMKEQKACAVEKASNSWVFSLDADERVTDTLKNFVLKELQSPASDGYRFPRKNYFLGKWLKHGGWYPDHVLRLFRKDKGHFGGINPHDRVIIENGSVATVDTPIVHITYKSLSQYLHKQNMYSSISAQEKVKGGKPGKVSPFMIVMKTAEKFLEVYIIKKGFLDGFHGLIAAIGATCAAFFKHAKIWELTHNKYSPVP